MALGSDQGWNQGSTQEWNPIMLYFYLLRVGAVALPQRVLFLPPVPWSGYRRIESISVLFA